MAAEYEVNIKINTQQVERDLKKVEKAVNNIGKSKGGKKQSVLALPSTEMLNATARKIQSLDKINRKVELRQREISKQTRDQALNINTLVKTQDRRARLLNKINEMEAKGLNVNKLRKQLEKATNQQIARRFGSAEKEFRILEKSIRLEQSKLRILKDQQKNFAASPVRGTVSMAGSPAQMEAIKKVEMAEIRAAKNAHFAELKLIQKRQKVQMDNIDKELAKDIKALNAFDKKLAASDDARAKRLAGARIPGLGSGQIFGPSFPTGGAASPVGGGLNFPGSPIANAEANRIAQLNAGLTGQTSPIRGGIFQKGSPNQKRFEGVALGAGFPALFGGGPGSIIGGGLGGLTGSFGAQIGLSAIGQQVDAFIASVARVGTALTSATGTVEMFREKNLFSSDAVKEHAFQLEEQGKMQELATLLTKDLASQIGKNAVENFQALGGELKEFLGTVNQLFLSVQGFVAGPLAKLLSAINTVLGGVSTDVQFGSLRESLTGDAAAQFEAIVAETRGTRELTSQERQRAISQQRSTDPVEGRLTTAVKEAILKDPRIAKLRQTINVTGQTTLDDTLSFKPSRSKTDTERAAAVLKSAQEKLQIMQQEGSLAKELKRLDFDRAAEIDKINKLESATTEERKAAITATDKLFDARKGEVIGKALSEDLEKAIKLKEAQEDVLRPLEDQRRLLDGKLKGNEEEVRLQLEIEKILRSVEGLNRQDVEDALRKNAALEEQVKQVERLEQLYQQVGSAIENGIVNGIMSAIDGSKSLGESLSGILKQLGGMFLKAGIGSFGIGGQAGSGLLGLLPFAEGGYVSGPTPALIGEGGQGEYVIPESKMRESMSRYSRGSRGDSVIPTSGGGTGDSGGGTAVAAPIDVRYTVERINSVDYVTADQFQSGMQSAAAQGAQRGEQNTLKRLQMSGSTRKRIGL